MKGGEITTMSEEINKKSYSQEEFNSLMYAMFAKTARQPLVDLTSNTKSTLSFQKFTKDKIIEFLKNPQRNEKNIRDASIYMNNNSSQYHRLMAYYSLMATWAYIILPSKFDSQKAKTDAYKKQYIKTSQYIENMQIPHEMQKVADVVFREDVFYGVTWETSDSFMIQPINPDWCELSSKEDGIFNFAVDISKIKEEELQFYPPEFTSMWNEYKKDGIKRKEVLTKISACFKLNEGLMYPLPIFAGTMASLHDIEDYKALAKARTEVGNYKLINMEIPTKDGQPTMLWDDIVNYYNQLLSQTPENVGATASPAKLNTIEFEKSGGLNNVDDVSKAEEQFYNSSGTSQLNFGGNKSSISSLKISIKSDEAIVIGFIRQVERWINRRLKDVSGTVKFKIKMLPITAFNQEEMFKLYKEAASYGLPTKTMMGAVLGINGGDFEALNYLETEVLELQDKMIPLSSSYTQSSDSIAGRPTAESKGEELTEAGEKTAESDGNAGR
ncbi:MAG: hypothetical protein RR806_03195 [Oscillospiraceae bacterium]